MADPQKQLLYLFERPFDPVNMPRGDSSVFYKLSGTDTVSTRAGTSPGNTVTVRSRPEINKNSLGLATSVPRGVVFCYFLKSHRQAARCLCDIFMRARTSTDLMELALNVRDQVNESLFIYALSFTILRKQELRSVRLPPIVEVFPQKFIPTEDLTKMQVEMNRTPASQTTPMVIEYGADFANTTLKPEHRVSYWREDYGINSHHWHWHLVYPIDMNVNRDRKGELFYYMHQQMIARYDMERLSVNLKRVEKLENWREPIPDGYFSKLTVNNSGRPWGTRQDNTLLKDLRRNEFGLDVTDISDMELWRSRLMDAIHQGYMLNRNGERIPLSDNVTTGKRGIDILADAFEADGQLSPNFLFYGDLHNIGHLMLAFCHDSDNAHREEMGVVGDNTTAMRDPVFYRWHKFVDDVFQEYKLTQPPYTMEDLTLPGVVLDKVGVVRDNQLNTLTTGWNVREFEASRGLDFNSTNPVAAHHPSRPCSLRLSSPDNKQHRKSKSVTVRIFMAPKHNERGLEMGFMEQRLLWAEMDKFTEILKPGKNQIVRPSSESSITTSSEFTFRSLEAVNPAMPGAPQNTEANFCGCGWPDHLLLPRSKPEGMTYQLFFMLTDLDKDKVDQPAVRRCADAVSFCGILDAKFPDKRPMGFPFDRRPPPSLQDAEVTSAADYARLGNITIQDITITFLNNNLQKSNN
ncbi:LOW QUALITY PROTEIN: phenoloxidase 2 [Procambarus clarkii]|uniref:LOW QUALITY PROTEIN: phenoloxidase 2 n=1 Tax=Procambarus clarkii TaxID=6728 RepID=UPI003741FFE4